MENVHLYDLSCISSDSTRLANAGYIEGKKKANEIPLLAYKRFDLRVRDALFDVVTPNHTSFEYIDVNDAILNAEEITIDIPNPLEDLVHQEVQEIDSADDDSEDTEYDFGNIKLVDDKYEGAEDHQFVLMNNPYGSDLVENGQYEQVREGIENLRDVDIPEDRILGQDGNKVIAVEKREGSASLGPKKKLINSS